MCRKRYCDWNKFHIWITSMHNSGRKKRSFCSFIGDFCSFIGDLIIHCMQWWCCKWECTLVETLHWIRFLIHRFDGCELIASWMSIKIYDLILHSSLLNANTTCFCCYVLRPEITIYSHQPTQQFTNVIKCGVPTGVTPTHNTINTTNKLSSH